jgi:predicted N-acetyltransferase YhbS
MFEVTGYGRAHLPGVLALCTAEGWLSLPADPQRANRVLSAPGVTTVVAVAAQTGDVVGFAELLSDGELQSYLANLLVGVSWRGRGVARVLVAEALRQAGGERVDLLSEDAAVGFYQALNHREKRGFRLYPPFTPGTRSASCPGRNDCMRQDRLHER